MKDNIVYVKTENGIFKCYESETMHKPIYYLVNSNGYIDYTEVIKVLTIDDLFIENQGLKNQQKEFIEYLEDYIYVLKKQQLDIGEEHTLMTLEEVLDKYKEIIGFKDEQDL